jgi:hypothetical protein
MCVLYIVRYGIASYIFRFPKNIFAAVRAGPHQAGGRIAAFNACGLAWRARP